MPDRLVASPFVAPRLVATLLAALAWLSTACASEIGDEADALTLAPAPARAPEGGAFDGGRAPTSPTDAGARGESVPSPTDGAAPPDAAPPAAPAPAPPAPPLLTPAPCGAPGAAVHASTDATAAWRYATSPDVTPGFAAQGLAFRLASDTSSEARADLYLLKSEKHGDYLVSTVPSEGASEGYGAIAVLGTVYLHALPGTVPLTRYYQTSPRLRHRLSIDGAIAGWDPEPPRGHVCPR